MNDRSLHDVLRARGHSKLGVRLKILASLSEPTAHCLERYLTWEAASHGQRPPTDHAAPASDLGHTTFVVVHAPAIVVRQLPDVNAPRLNSYFIGDEIMVAGEVDGWLRLADRDGWVLRDGRRLGLGELVRPLPSPSARDELAALPPLSVRATDGLCNRLRVVLSYAQVARQHGRPLLVWWPLNNVCDGRFDEAFEPLDGVRFCDTPPGYVGFCPNSHDFHPEVKAYGEAACTACYGLLRPLPAVAARVAANVAELRAPPHADAGFVALHIRRTDHWGSTATDDDYMAFVGRHARHAVFLATDNATTQGKFIDHPTYGPRVRACKRIVADTTKLRQTSLADAAVDVFTATEADGPFQGTYSSSFSDTIHRLRRLRGTDHANEHELSDAQFQMAVNLHTPGGHKQHSPGQPMETNSAK
jgi:hypothetical protein